ncbi:MAG: division/cell wall cluster transcriptional repressor MraZ [Deltaproteobacteria bacterium]|nr:division/cell wall cluster transcriptional repressor MraZ [Deltaproteobacteria bacterium]
MFTGWSEHSIDAKGRVAIPARFRDLLKAKRDDRLVITTSERCLVAYPQENWRALVDKVARLSPLDPTVQAFRRYFVSGAIEVNLDKQGRVLLPQLLREFAGLEGSALLAGMQNCFEIWDKDRWYQERSRIQEDFGKVATMMAELGV